MFSTDLNNITRELCLPTDRMSNLSMMLTNPKWKDSWHCWSKNPSPEGYQRKWIRGTSFEDLHLVDSFACTSVKCSGIWAHTAAHGRFRKSGMFFFVNLGMPKYSGKEIGQMKTEWSLLFPTLPATTVSLKLLFERVVLNCQKLVKSETNSDTPRYSPRSPW